MSIIHSLLEMLTESSKMLIKVTFLIMAVAMVIWVPCVPCFMLSGGKTPDQTKCLGRFCKSYKDCKDIGNNCVS